MAPLSVFRTGRVRLGGLVRWRCPRHAGLILAWRGPPRHRRGDPQTSLLGQSIPRRAFARDEG